MAEMVFYNLLSTYLLRCNLFKQDFFVRNEEKVFSTSRFDCIFHFTNLSFSFHQIKVFHFAKFREI